MGEFCAMEAGRGKLLRCPLCRETLEDFRLATVGFERARVLLTDASRCRQAGVRTGLVRHTQVSEASVMSLQCPPANEGQASAQGEPYDETTRLPRLPPRRVGGLRRNVTVRERLSQL